MTKTAPELVNLRRAVRESVELRIRTDTLRMSGDMSSRLQVRLDMEAIKAARKVGVALDACTRARVSVPRDLLNHARKSTRTVTMSERYPGTAWESVIEPAVWNPKTERWDEI